MLVAPGRSHREAECVDLPASGVFNPVELERREYLALCVASLLTFDPRVAAQLQRAFDWYANDFYDEGQVEGHGN